MDRHGGAARLHIISADVFGECRGGGTAGRRRSSPHIPPADIFGEQNGGAVRLLTAHASYSCARYALTLTLSLSRFTLYTLHFTLYTLHFTLYALHFTLYTLPPDRMLFSGYCAQCTNFTLYALHTTVKYFTLYTLHFTLFV